MPLVIEDKVTGYLKQLGIVAPNYINEALSKGASIMYKEIKKKASTYHDTDFSQFHNDGKRGIAGKGAYSKLQQRESAITKNATLTNYGKAFRRTSKTEPNTPANGASNMAELTRWRVYYGKMKAVVGWMNTKSFSPLSIENGEVKGHLSPVKGTKIFDKEKNNFAYLMENGGVVYLSEAQKNLFRVSGMSKAARRGYVVRKARPLIAPAFSSSRSKSEEKMMEAVKKIVDYNVKNNNIRVAS